MQRWVESLFSAQTVDALAPLIAQQVQIGEVHAHWHRYIWCCVVPAA